MTINENADSDVVRDITVYVIISADKDMIPLMNRLKFYGKNVHLVYLEAAIAEDKLILSFADSATSIESMLGIEVATQDELSAEELDKLVPDTVQIVKDFYTRNAGKPNMYLGQKLFVDELIQKKHIAGKVASKLLEHCLTNNHWDLIEQTGTSYKKVVTKNSFSCSFSNSSSCTFSEKRLSYLGLSFYPQL